MASRYRHNAYRMTPARRAALKKAQIASARKRKRNKRIIVAASTAGVLAGVGVGAYLGAKHGPAAANIARDVKRQAPQRIASAKKQAIAAVGEGAKHATRMRAGLTKGVASGAGPDAGAKVPKAKTFKVIHIPTITRSQADVLMARATKKRTQEEAWAKRTAIEAKGTGEVAVFGIPAAILHKRKLSQHKAMQQIERDSRARRSAGGMSMTPSEKLGILNEMIFEGNVRKTFYGRKAKKTIGMKGAYGVPDRVGKLKGRRPARAKKAPLTPSELKYRALEQFIQDFDG